MKIKLDTYCSNANMALSKSVKVLEELLDSDSILEHHSHESLLNIKLDVNNSIWGRYIAWLLLRLTLHLYTLS